MKHRNLITCLFVALFLFLGSFTSVSAKASKEYVVYSPVESVYLYFNDDGSVTEVGGVVPLGTISSADLVISRSIGYHYSGNPGNLTYLEINVTWEWLIYINNYLEDSITISWDNTYDDWRFYSNTVVRKHYTKANIQTNWTLRSTDYSVRSAAINGFIYDETLIGPSYPGWYPTKNKGTISFSVYPYSQLDPTFNFYLMVEYDHKIFNVLGGNGDSISFGGVTTAGVPILTYNKSLTYKYDSQSLAIGSTWYSYVPH